ncbi:MAG: exo-alpha-sialidase, partial [Elusimicrobiota bacterium]
MIAITRILLALTAILLCNCVSGYTEIIKIVETRSKVDKNNKVRITTVETFYNNNEMIAQILINEKGKVVEKEGKIPDGIVKEYSKDDKSYTEWNYAGEKITGISTKYYEAGQQKKEVIYKNKLLPPSEGNPRNSEGAFVKLNDNRIMFVYTHYYSGTGGDHDKAYLAARYSSYDGKSWSTEDQVVVQNEGQCNVMSVSLLRLKNGDILIGYLVKNTGTDCGYYIRRSTDDGKTWNDRVEVTHATIQGYHVVNNDRMIQLSTGRVVVPVASCGKAEIFFSDDNGYTWQCSNSILESPVAMDSEIMVFGIKGQHKSGLQEPGVVELKDGTLMLWARTDLGCQYESFSKDSGKTWSAVEKSSLISPCSPASIKRIPSTGDLLVVYNDHSGRFPFTPLKRTPLVTAISKDEGKTWVNHKQIEDDPYGWYCYIAIEFVGENIVLAYCSGDKTVGKLRQIQVT